ACIAFTQNRSTRPYTPLPSPPRPRLMKPANRPVVLRSAVVHNEPVESSLSHPSLIVESFHVASRSAGGTGRRVRRTRVHHHRVAHPRPGHGPGATRRRAGRPAGDQDAG